VNVTVIGAGIIGTCLALRLAERGVSVTLIDAVLPGSGTSASGLGHVNVSYQGYESYYDVRAMGLEAYARLEAQWPAEFPWFVRSGHLALVSRGGGQGEIAEYADTLQERGHEVVELDAHEALALEPDLILDADDRVFFYPEEGFILGRPMLAHLLGISQQYGVVLRCEDPVVALEVTGARMAGVALASGRRVPADVVAVCCGRWSHDVLALAGAAVPLVTAEESGSPAIGLTIVSTPTVARLARVVTAGSLSLRPDGGGRVMVQSAEHDRLLPGPPPSAPAPAVVTDLLDCAGRYLRWLNRAEIEAAHICIRPLPEDGLPVVGWTDAIDGAYVIVSHAGATLAPVLGELAAEEIVGGANLPILARYRPSRFAALRN
jgi:glycine/D-amino acid oxidase-like deaminating enzyme